jgi:ribosomal protein S18 acetylase RimI-like enzyme
MITLALFLAQAGASRRLRLARGGKMASIRYVASAAEVAPEQLTGFFVGWPNPPSPHTHLRLLHASDHIVLALAEEGGSAGPRVVGYITALSDGVLCAYISSLEVLPEFQGQGIGSELVRRMLDKLRDLYMIDLICDPDVQPFYARLGLRPAGGMILRNYDRQAGGASK